MNFAVVALFAAGVLMAGDALAQQSAPRSLLLSDENGLTSGYFCRTATTRPRGACQSLAGFIGQQIETDSRPLLGVGVVASLMYGATRTRLGEVQMVVHGYAAMPFVRIGPAKLYRFAGGELYLTINHAF